MKSITEYIGNIFEGGEGGHMAHPYDYSNFTGNDLKELINNLFDGKIEHLKEKLDGMNLFATMNNDGEVVYIRNKGNLNSERGGMSIDDMAQKWSDRPHQKEVFIKAANIIEKIFKRLGVKYFNPDANHRKIINCECIICGKTNIMLYAKDRVAFHGYKIYVKENGKYIEEKDVEGDVDDIYAAANDIEAATPRPDLVMKNVEKANDYAKSFTKSLEDLFKNENLTMDNTIEDYKKVRFNNIKPTWMIKHVDEIYNRWFNNDKSFSAAILKKDYQSHYSEIMDDKLSKKYQSLVIAPLDTLFLSMGNALISILSGFTNDKESKAVIDNLKKELEACIDSIKKSDDADKKNKLEYNIQRLNNIGNDINSAEGVVFIYKGKRMKFTGSFAPVNAILGLIYK